MYRRTAWVAGFLGLTALAIAMELLAAFDASAATVPWTDLLVSLPWWVPGPVTAVFVIWLPIHLWLAYRARQRAARTANDREPDSLR